MKLGVKNEELKKLERMLMEVLEREKDRKRERVEWKMKRKGKRPVKTPYHGLDRFTTGCLWCPLSKRLHFFLFWIFFQQNTTGRGGMHGLPLVF